MTGLVHRFGLWVLPALLVSTPPAPDAAAQEYRGEIEAFESFVSEQMKLDRIPGLSVGFSKDGFLWARGFGQADLEHGTPATERSSYRLASNTKSMTAVAILQLAEKGLVDLDAEVQAYVPYFPRKRRPVTVRQLLGHIGGISHYVDDEVEGHIKEHKDTRDALAIFANFDLVAEPGAEFHYSSYGYNLLGAVIEGAARQPYGSYLRERLWKPLGMDDTHMDDPDEIIPGRVAGYRLFGGEWKNSEFVDVSSRFAAGGTHSTVVDLLAYAQGLDAARVLSEQSTELMHTSLTTSDGRFTDYALGWGVEPVNGRFHVLHAGGQPETRTLLMRFPRERLDIAVAYNLEGADIHLYGRRLAQLVLGEAWNRQAYAGGGVNQALYRALWEIFNFGLAYFDRHGDVRSESEADLSAAFEYVNSSVSRGPLEADHASGSQRLQDGRHPVAQEAFVKVGSYIASRLLEAKGAEGLETYHARGALSFLADYVKLSRGRGAEARVLSPEVSDLVTRWARDWERTSGVFRQGLAIMPSSDVGEIRARLQRLFRGAECYPDLTPDLGRTTGYLYLSGDARKAAKVAQLSVELYPDSALSHVMLGNVYVCLGDKARARQAYERARALDEQVADAARLNRYALQLWQNGRATESSALFEVAAGLFPHAAVLYESLAEIHLERSRALFEKALEVDPTTAHARSMLEKLDR